MVIELELPWPPSVNRYYRHFAGRTLLSRAGHEYRKHVLAKLASKDHPCFAGAVTLAAEFYPPDSRKRDLDNLLKATLDALQHAGLFEDDGQIEHLDIRRKEPHRPDGLVTVKVTGL